MVLGEIRRCLCNANSKWDPNRDHVKYGKALEEISNTSYDVVLSVRPSKTLGRHLFIRWAKRPRGNPNWQKADHKGNPGDVVAPASETTRKALLRLLDQKPRKEFNPKSKATVLAASEIWMGGRISVVRRPSFCKIFCLIVRNSVEFLDWIDSGKSP
jgi:hypothetical protein